MEKQENTIFSKKTAIEIDIDKWHFFRIDLYYMMHLTTKNGNFFTNTIF